MISHDLQEWLTRTSAEQPAPLPTCCCEQLTCRSSELFKDTIKRLEGESRLAAGALKKSQPLAITYYNTPLIFEKLNAPIRGFEFFFFFFGEKQKLAKVCY